MSILIHGMEMPRVCAECFMDPPCCKALSDDTNIWKERHPDCPLVEIPTPHGRLGDLDELKTAFPRCDNSMDIKIASVRATINHAPTVIEAEGRET